MVRTGSRRHAAGMVGGLLLAAWLVAPAAGWAGEGAPAPPERARLAVATFAGSGGPEGFGEALAQALREALRQVRRAELLPSAALEEAARTASASPREALLETDALPLARALRVRALVAGSYAVEGEGLTVRTRLVEPGRAAAPVEQVAGPVAEFPALQAQLARALLARLGIRPSEHDERRLGTLAALDAPTPAAYVLYARAVWEQGLGTKAGHEEAIRLLTRATELEPNFALARVALADAFRATSNRWRGVQELRKVIQLAPNLAEVHQRLGELLLTSPRRPFDQAVQAFQRVLELSPDAAEAWVGLGDARHAKGQPDEAIRDYRRALALEPRNARVHFGLGKIYYQEKQLYHEAVAEYQRALALEPTFVEAHVSLGELYEEKGLYQEAIARYRHVLGLDQRHPGASYGLALAYEKVDTAQAIAHWERYIELARTLPSEKDWVDIAEKHLAKLRRGEKPH